MIHKSTFWENGRQYAIISTIGCDSSYDKSNRIKGQIPIDLTKSGSLTAALHVIDGLQVEGWLGFGT